MKGGSRHYAGKEVRRDRTSASFCTSRRATNVAFTCFRSEAARRQYSTQNNLRGQILRRGKRLYSPILRSDRALLSRLAVAPAALGSHLAGR